MKAFSYSATVKLLLDGGNTVMAAEYPGVTDISILSREFIDYNECLLSCRTFMESMKDKINDKSDNVVFMLSSEVNPKYSGQVTLSKDWDSGEVARLWIFDQKMEKTGQIHAAAQARVYTTDKPKSVALSS